MKYLFKKKTLAAAVSAFDLVGRGLFALAPRRKAPAAFRHALVVRLDHLGDILPATAVPKMLKENLGVGRVTFLTSSTGAALVRNNPFVDHALVYDAPWFSRGRRPAGDNYPGLVGRLKGMDIDLGLSLRGDLRENTLLCLAGIPERVGYGVTGGGFLLTREVPYRWGVHEREHTLDLLRAIGIRAATLDARIYFSDEEKESFEARTAEWGLDKSSPVGIQFEAGSRAKEWPEVNAKQFLKAAAKKFEKRALIFVGTDKARFRWLSSYVSEHPQLPWTDFLGKTDIRELAYIVSRLSAFIGPDSGPAHLAAAFGVPTLFLYSGTNAFSEWRSLAERADFLKNAVPCAPCGLTECRVEGHPCMAGIDAERVIDWVAQKP